MPSWTPQRNAGSADLVRCQAQVHAVPPDPPKREAGRGYDAEASGRPRGSGYPSAIRAAQPPLGCCKAGNMDLTKPAVNHKQDPPNMDFLQRWWPDHATLSRPEQILIDTT